VGAASPFRLAASIRTDPRLLWQGLYANRDETGAYRQPLFRCMSDPIITRWNPAAEKLFGYSSEEIIGTSVAVMSRKDRPEEISGILAKVRAGEHIHHLENHGLRARMEAAPTWHKHALRRSVAGSSFETEPGSSASGHRSVIGTATVDERDRICDGRGSCPEARGGAAALISAREPQVSVVK
jgi:PAS domain-containing protein